MRSRSPLRASQVERPGSDTGCKKAWGNLHAEIRGRTPKEKGWLLRIEACRRCFAPSIARMFYGVKSGVRVEPISGLVPWGVSLESALGPTQCSQMGRPSTFLHS